MKIGKTKARSINIADRRSRAIALRKTGATLEAVAAVIAQEFNQPKYDKSFAFKDIDVALKDLNERCSHDTEEYRRQELEILDDCQFRLQAKVKVGDVQAIAQVVKISERRAKLLGLEAPIQLQVEQIVDQELRAFIDGLQPLLPRETYNQVLEAVQLIGDRSAMAGNN
jgi:hypothetical protein